MTDGRCIRAYGASLAMVRSRVSSDRSASTVKVSEDGYIRAHQAITVPTVPQKSLAVLFRASPFGHFIGKILAHELLINATISPELKNSDSKSE